MKLSTPTRYAIRLLFELAKSSRPVPIHVLSDRTGIALRPIETITAELRQHGLTGSVLGAGGGLTLLRPLHEITLGHIIFLFDGGVQLAVCYGEKSGECPKQRSCDNIAEWRLISQKIQEDLNAITLERVFHKEKHFLP